MSTLLAGGILLSFAAGPAILLKKRVEELLAVAIFGIVGVLYLSGLAGDLEAGFRAVLVLAAAAAVAGAVLIVRHRDRAVQLLLTPGLLAFCLFLGMVWFGHRGRMFSEWDEFSHWGLVIKNMYTLDRLGNAAQATTTFRGYPPAASLFAYFWIKLSGAYRESDAFRSMDIFLLTLVLPAFKRLRWKHGGRILAALGVALLLPCQFNATALTTIYVDTLLGFVLAFVFFQYLTTEKRPAELGILCLALCILPLIKASGTGLALIAALILLVDVLRQKGWPPARRAAWATAPLLAVLAGKYSWDIYLKLTHTAEAWNSSKLTPGAVWNLLRGNGEAYQKDVISDFFKGILFPSRYSFGYLFKLSVFAWGLVFILLAAVLILTLRDRREKQRYTLCLAGVIVGFAVYGISLLLLYLFTFTPYEARNLASFTRYISTYLTGMFVLLACLYLDRFAPAENPTGAVCYLVLGCMLVSSDGHNLLPVTFGAEESVAASMAVRADCTIPQDVLDKLDPDTDRVYTVSQHDNGFYYWIEYYNFTPVKSDTAIWSLGAPYDEADVWTKDLSAEEFAATLQDYTHLYLYKVDEQFVERYGALFEDPGAIGDKTLFRVEKDGSTLTLAAE